MISFFPDLNVWLALSDSENIHNPEAWNWFGQLPRDSHLIFSRYTQLGLLRLLATEAVMRDRTHTLRKAWGVYDRWMEDPRVEFHVEPRAVDVGFRLATEPFGGKPAAKVIGDCYLLAFAKHSHATLVTFDRTLYTLAGRQGCSAIIPA